MIGELYLKLIGLGAVGIVVVGGVILFGSHERQVGWDNHAAAVAAQDKEAIDAVARSRTKVEACRAGGGTWDTSSGVCDQRPSVGSGG
jgi:hypothetical protein